MRLFSFLFILILLFPIPAFALTGNLSWTAGDTLQTGFNIYRAPDATGVFAKIGSAIATSFQDLGASPGNCYQVTAFNAVGESAPSTMACLPIVPKPPTGLIVVIVVTP